MELAASVKEEHCQAASYQRLALATHKNSFFAND